MLDNPQIAKNLLDIIIEESKLKAQEMRQVGDAVYSSGKIIEKIESIFSHK